MWYQGTVSNWRWLVIPQIFFFLAPPPSAERRSKLAVIGTKRFDIAIWGNNQLGAELLPEVRRISQVWAPSTFHRRIIFFLSSNNNATHNQQNKAFSLPLSRRMKDAMLKIGENRLWLPQKQGKRFARNAQVCSRVLLNLSTNVH